MTTVQKRDSFRIVLARCLRYGVNSVKVPARLALIGGLSFGVAAGVATFAAGSFFTNLIQQARDVYTVYRLTGERDELAASNQRLEREVKALQHEYARKVEFSQEVRAKLSSLENTLVTAGAMSLFGDGDSKAKQKVASKDKDSDEPTKSGSLAAILKSSELQGRAGKADTDTSKCASGEGCIAGARKQKISISTDAEEDELIVAPLNALFDAELVRSQEESLIDSLDYFSSISERLPIGTPVIGRYTSGFGYRSSPFSSRSSFHQGIDVSIPRGAKVVATGAGVVKTVEYQGHYGLTVDIQHTPDVVTRYAHLSKATVRVGQAVDRGDRIGLSGSSGRATGPHVHYEVIYKGVARNPKPFVLLADSVGDVL